VQRIIKVLRNDGILRVKTRRYSSNRFFIIADALLALPLAASDEVVEQASAEPQPRTAQAGPTAPDCSAFTQAATDLARKIAATCNVAELPAAWVEGVASLMLRHGEPEITTALSFAADDPYWNARGFLGDISRIRSKISRLLQQSKNPFGGQKGPAGPKAVRNVVVDRCAGLRSEHEFNSTSRGDF
jgi:hypothetical protein